MTTPTFFGREPALWMALASSAIMFFSAFVFALTPEQQGTLNAVTTAVFGLLTAWTVASDGIQAAILGFLKAIFALAIAFGLHLTPENQAVAMTLAAAVTAMFIRQTSVAPVGANDNVRTNAEVKAISMNMKKAASILMTVAMLSAATVTPLVLTSCAGGIGGAVTTAEAWWNDPANQAKIQEYVQWAETIAGFIVPLLGANQTTVSMKVQAKFTEEHPNVVLPAGALKKIADAGTRRAIEKRKASR